MRFDEIMLEITRGLTGDAQHDIPYLRDIGEKYKDHELSQEILRACGRLLYERIAPEQRKELERIMENETLGHESILEEVRFKVYQKKFEEARALLEGYIEKLERMDAFQDDSVSEYRCFNQFMEEALYHYWEKPEKTVRSPAIRYDAVYLQYGSLLIDLKRPGDARDALEKAMHWAPACADIAFEHAETFKMQGDMEAFLRATIEIFKYAFLPRHVAHCYRNIGYYYVERRLWKEAAACYSLSLDFEPDSKNAMSELYYIHEQAGQVGEARPEALAGYAKMYGFPIGPHEAVLGLAYAYGSDMAKKGQVDGARYCLGIVYDLTHDERIRGMLDALPKED